MPRFIKCKIEWINLDFVLKIEKIGGGCAFFDDSGSHRGIAIGFDPNMDLWHKAPAASGVNGVAIYKQPAPNAPIVEYVPIIARRILPQASPIPVLAEEAETNGVVLIPNGQGNPRGHRAAGGLRRGQPHSHQRRRPFDAPEGNGVAP